MPVEIPMTDETADEADVDPGNEIEDDGHPGEVDGGEDIENDGHLAEIEDGAGCTEIWDFLSRRRIENDS